MVIGVGGLGHLAVQILKATTAARIVAIDPRQSARDLALKGGADVVTDADAQAVEVIRETSRGSGADVVIDCVGSDETFGAGGRLRAPARGHHHRRTRR